MYTCYSLFLLHLSRFYLQTSAHSYVVSLLFHLCFRGEPNWSRFSHCPYIIILSPVPWGETFLSSVYLPVCLSAYLSLIAPWSAVQYWMEGESSVGDFPYSILQQEATQLLQDSETPAKPRIFPLVKSSLKMKAFPAMVPTLKGLQCHTLEVEWTDSTFCLQLQHLLTF